MASTCISKRVVDAAQLTSTDIYFWDADLSGSIPGESQSLTKTELLTTAVAVQSIIDELLIIYDAYKRWTSPE